MASKMKMIYSCTEELKPTDTQNVEFEYRESSKEFFFQQLWRISNQTQAWSKINETAVE